MNTPSFVLLYVESPAESAAFYADLLGQSPVDSSPTFAMFVLPSGIKLGLWSRQDADPKPGARGGGGELGIPVGTVDEVRRTHADWKGRGIPILQPVTQMDFGLTFVGADPDGHRLRVFHPEAS
jgi:catechol 2,3-dioxygenase-like lactoylglutathione lyase family enzyme